MAWQIARRAGNARCARWRCDVLPIPLGPLAPYRTLIVAAALLGAGVVAGLQINAWRYGLQLAELRAAQAQASATAATTALAQQRKLAGNLGQIAADLVAASDKQQRLAAAIARDYDDAAKHNPLPADCRPGPDRLRSLAEAASAANAAAAR
ncbi:hypothetical protein N8I74_11140 [Chitiniphilus purpureus]|uniref:DUF2570 domain-containing protein n=1 Tax=Chitiniphilus purpureus TaxID=2981137 RepID=A0ABY6DIL2_9NEIS|nr:hypothetical protein [Chitiniphilus sp. CD1]UXY13877.1 hypothetical protein N8I74_11140 [Chitiniphilus sp. CD1]